MLQPIIWSDGKLLLLDQTKLPTVESFVSCASHTAVAAAIKRMQVRGAPAIGVAAAFGFVLGAHECAAASDAAFWPALRAVAAALKQARPTAVNLAWAVDRMTALAEANCGLPRAELLCRLEQEALAMLEEDIAANRRIGRWGEPLIPAGSTVLTHCNTGALATAGYGTALGVIRAAHAAGKQIAVYADETRPFLQGARLTAYELQQEHIPFTLITDSMAGYFMQQGKIDLAIVGADRIAANGDTANKIGTYGVAVLAKAHRIPFYIAAPLSTVDWQIRTGTEIPIEERSPEEVTHIGGVQIAPTGVKVANPAFDVTPHEYITAVITDRGVAYPPFTDSLAALRQS